MSGIADPFDVAGRVVLVTGASSGLGRHFAAMLARRGARVALCARRLDALRDAVAGIAATGGTAIAVPLDVTDAGVCEACFEHVEHELGPVDVLINNSGVGNLGLIARSRRGGLGPDRRHQPQGRVARDPRLRTAARGRRVAAGR